MSDDELRQPETEPPTIPGEPVPVLDPVPDGEPGTSDDQMFLVAGADVPPIFTDGFESGDTSAWLSPMP